MTQRKKLCLRRLLKIALIAAMIWTVIVWSDRTLSPILRRVAAAQADIAMTRLINDVVTDILSDRELVKVEKTSDGQISSLKIDTMAANEIKSQVIDNITSQIMLPESSTIEVPLGMLTGIDLLSGSGHSIPVRIVSVKSVKADYATEFTDAGINQTIHRITLKITAEIVLLLPIESITLNVGSDVVVAETVIIGKVPLT